MNDSQQDKFGAEIPTPIGTLRIFGAYTVQVIIILTFAMVVTGAFLAYDLRNQINRSNELARRQLVATHVQNCLLVLDQDERSKYREWCRDEAIRRVNGY